MMLRAALPTLLVAGAVLVAAASATADPAHHKPPKEAFTACESHSAGDACQVTFGERTMKGTCRKGPDDQAALSCRPDRPPGPPPAAIDACQGKASGDTCSVTGPDGGTHDGTCRTRHDGNGPLACAPQHH
jgi:hypothetical protein